jgi:hypothetical protein
MSYPVLIFPAPKFSGVAGLVGTLTTTEALPVHTPLMEMLSPLCTSERKMVALLLTLCKLISTPLRNREAVACPMPEVKVISMLAALASLATRSLVLIFFDFGVLRCLLLLAGEGFGCAFFREDPDFFAAIGYVFCEYRMEEMAPSIHPAK